MDETLPLLEHADVDIDVERRESLGKNIVDFDPDGDDENPMDWPKCYKWGITSLLTFMAFTVTFTCISVVPVANRVVADLDHGNPSKSASVLLVTIWELGEAAGPLFIAPLSERFGRYPVVNAANVLFISATALAALSQSTGLFIAARALTGLAVASNVLSPAIVGDMFQPQHRGSAMSLIMLAPMIGGAVGPAISGAVAESLGWRHVVWVSVGLAGVCELLFLTCFRETYKVPILRRKAARLRDQTGDLSLRTEFDSEDVEGSKRLLEAILRPLVVFCGSGVLQAMSLFGSFVFTCFYIMTTTLPDILEELYNMSPAKTGSSFIAFSVGTTISVIFCNYALDKIYVSLRHAHQGYGQPELRLPLVVLGGFTLPPVLALYGWAAQLRVPVAILLLTVGMLGMTIMLGFLPLMAYVVDAFGIYSASAITALIVSRCLMGTFLPLATAPLVERLGYGWGFTVLAVALLALSPVPVFVMRYGAKWRQSSSYTRDQ